MKYSSFENHLQMFLNTKGITGEILIFYILVLPPAWKVFLHATSDSLFSILL